jgi:hypothetical protein
MELPVQHICCVLNVRAGPAPGPWAHPLKLDSVKTNYHHMNLSKIGLLCIPALIVHIQWQYSPLLGQINLEQRYGGTK